MANKVKFYQEGIDDFGTPAYMKVREPLYITILTKDGYYTHGYVDRNTSSGDLFEYLTSTFKGCKQISIGSL